MNIFRQLLMRLVMWLPPVNPSRLVEWLQILFAVLVAYLVYCFASLGFPL